MKTKLFTFMLFMTFYMHGQLNIGTGVELHITNGDILYANDNIVNNGSLFVNDGRLKLANNFSNLGVIDVSGATIEFVGGNTQDLIFATNDIVKNVVLNKSSNTVSVSSGKLTITDKLLSNGGTLDAGEKIVLQSTSTKTAIVEESVGGSIDNIVVERYIPAKRAFRLLSSPVVSSTSIQYNWQENQNNTSPVYANNSNTASGYGTHIAGSTTGANGFDATLSGNPSLFTFNNTTQNWSAISNTNTNTFSVGAAYRLMVRGDRSIDMNTNTPEPTNTTLRTRGSLKIGSHTISDLSEVENGFNFIGNPYQSPVDMEQVLINSTNINQNYYQVWDPKVGGANGRGAFVTYSFLTDLNNVDGSAVNAYLQPMQACFVNTISNGASSIVFQESNKFTTTNENVYRNANSQIPIIKLNLYDVASFNQGNTALDGLMLVFGSNFSNDVDAFDAQKLTNLDENLAVLIANNKKSIGSYNTPELASTYPLSISNYTKQNYIFKTNLTNYNGLTPYLYDKFLSTYTEIEDNMTYPFSVETSNPLSTAANRFDVVFSTTTLDLSDNELERLVTVFPNPATSGMFNCSVPSHEGAISIVVHNELGQKIDINQTSISNNLVQCTVNSPLALGVYHIIITLNNTTTVVKKWVVN